jgi:signal transduction histidine kinase
MFSRRWIWATALATVILVAIVFLLGLALRRDLALPREDFSAESVFLGTEASYVVDTGQIGEMTPAIYADLTSRMTPPAGKLPSLGFSYYQNGRLWFSFTVPSLATSETNWNVRLDDYRVRTARLFVVRGDSFEEHAWSHEDALRLAGLGTRVPVFRFDRDEIEGRTVLIGFNSLSALRPNVYVETDRFTDGSEQLQVVFTALLVGALWSLALYMLVLGLRFRAPTLLAAAGMSAWIGMFIMAAKGYFRILLSGTPWLADGIHTGTQPLIFTFALLLIIFYLDLPRRSPKVAMLVTLIALILPLQGIMIQALAMGYRVPYLFDFNTPTLIGTITAVTTVLWFAIARRDGRAWLFLACLGPMAAFSITRVIVNRSSSADRFWINLENSFVDIVAAMMLLGLIAVLDLQRRERALRRAAVSNEQRFRSFAEIASDSYFETDANGIVTSAAGPLARELGLAEGVDLRATLETVATPGQYGPLSALNAAIEGKHALRDIEIGTGAQTGGRWIAVGVTPWQESAGSPTGLRGTIADATDRVTRRTREARDATLSALGQLAGGVAHEVNNLLHPMVNLARRVRDKPIQDDESRKLLDLVVSSGVHAGEIVAEVLNSFNPSQTPGTPVPLGTALKDALIAVRATLPSTVVLDQRIAEGSPVSVVSGEVLQIVSNVIGNAVRAMDGVGRIEVALDLLPDGKTRLIIADNGPGMPESVRLRATEPFVSGRAAGTGLGLSVVANIVRKWHGELEIRSAPGAGTVIAITLPATAMPALASAAQ